MAEAGVVLADEGGVGSDGVTRRSAAAAFTERHVRAIVSWLRLASTLATRKRAVDELPPACPLSSLA